MRISRSSKISPLKENTSYQSPTRKLFRVYCYLSKYRLLLLLFLTIIGLLAVQKKTSYFFDRGEHNNRGENFDLRNINNEGEKHAENRYTITRPTEFYDVVIIGAGKLQATEAV